MEAMVVSESLKTETNICKRCHRKLKDEESIQLGFGRICYQKQLQHQKIYLFDMEELHETTTKRNL